jgi:hypothetical protein
MRKARLGLFYVSLILIHRESLIAKRMKIRQLRDRQQKILRLPRFIDKNARCFTRKVAGSPKNLSGAALTGRVLSSLRRVASLATLWSMEQKNTCEVEQKREALGL